ARNQMRWQIVFKILRNILVILLAAPLLGALAMMATGGSLMPQNARHSAWRKGRKQRPEKPFGRKDEPAASSRPGRPPVRPLAVVNVWIEPNQPLGLLSSTNVSYSPDDRQWRTDTSGYERARFSADA